MQYFSMHLFRRPVIETAVCFLLILACYWLAPLAPAIEGWENGPIENTQVVILLSGLVCAIVFFFRLTEPRQKAFWLSVMPIWPILAARELSWGAVFYPPLEFMGYSGPVYSSHIQLWYKPFVTPVILVLLGLALLNFIRTRQHLTLLALFRGHHLPFSELFVVVLFMIASAASEGHMGDTLSMLLDLDMGAPQVFEESTELFAYLTLLLAQYRVWRAMSSNTPS